MIDDDGGITNVIIDEPGYGYEGFPYGDKVVAVEFGQTDAKSTVLRASVIGTYHIVMDKLSLFSTVIR